MIVSEARREANRRNALKSSGPRTEAGKERSRRNALTHGLSAEVVRLPEDEPATSTPAAPSPLDWPAWLAEQVGVIAGRIRRCDRLDARHRDRVARRAGSHWDDDRRVEAEFLGSGIARDPAAVALMLRMSTQGCDWLIARWALLARAADRDGAWTDAQRSLAFDLLGTPLELRGGDPAESLDPEGRPAPGATPDSAALARRESAALARRKLDLAPSEALDRTQARLEPDAADDPELRKLRRHEADLHRRLRWCVAQLAHAAPAPEPVPPPRPRPQAAPTPRPSLPDDSDLELDLDFDPTETLAALIAQAEARRHPQPEPPTHRPDPRLALEKARQADRQRKRDRRS